MGSPKLDPATIFCWEIIVPLRRQLLLYYLGSQLLSRATLRSLLFVSEETCFLVVFLFVFDCLLEDGYGDLRVTHGALLRLLLLLTFKPLHQALIVEKVTARRYLSDICPACEDLLANGALGNVELVDFLRLPILNNRNQLTVAVHQRNMRLLRLRDIHRAPHILLPILIIVGYLNLPVWTTCLLMQLHR